MPIFSYRCEIHGAFDQWVASRQAETECPICEKKSPRVFNPTLATTLIPRRWQYSYSDFADPKTGKIGKERTPIYNMGPSGTRKMLKV